MACTLYLSRTPFYAPRFYVQKSIVVIEGTQPLLQQERLFEKNVDGPKLKTSLSILFQLVLFLTTRNIAAKTISGKSFKEQNSLRNKLII